MIMSSPAVEYVSECFVHPKFISTPEQSRRPLYLSPWDLVLVDFHYIQNGLLFAKPPFLDDDPDQMRELLEKLKGSLSIALVHFYPLAGRLATRDPDPDPSVYSSNIYVDCANGPGVKFIHASSMDLTISDVLSPIHVPKIVDSFFDHVGAVNYDGHTRPLMTIQVTELVDGIFIGLSVNHMLVDGTSFLHFVNSWSEISRRTGEDQTGAVMNISRPPNHRRWLPEGHGRIFIDGPTSTIDIDTRNQMPELKQRFFHFPSESLRKLKARANPECGDHDHHSTKISTFQALCAHVWRCITRARNLPSDQVTGFRTSVNIRSRMVPPLSDEYFGNGIQLVATSVTVGELMSNGVGWAAWKLHELVINNQTDRSERDWVESWEKKSSLMGGVGEFLNTVQVGGSPRFNAYGSECDFGLGKALACRSGPANKFDGKIMLFPAREGGGNIDMEICLLPHFMTCLESDDEFLETISY